MSKPASDDDWARTDTLFSQCLELPPEEREVFLERAAQGDAALAQRVRQLLAASEAGEALLEHRDAIVTDLLDEEDETILPEGASFAGYRIKGVLGEGGMARVYLAEQHQDEWTREVAIKLIHHGRRDMTRRFQSECRILAGLEHPGIARLIDTGFTEEDQPFLVTEYVDGKPLTKYCQEKDCSLRERLELFLQLADAIQYAHGRVIIHRDLKPSNVLVDETGRVRLLDFGIARLDDSEEASVITRTAAMMMTPEYAAPEQLTGSALGTAVDIYQMGLLLFELLVGQPAWKNWKTKPGRITRELPPASVALTTRVRQEAGRDGLSREMRQAIRSLKGDLDAIIAKATASVPEERYATVQAMAGDVRAYLSGRRISVRRDSVPRAVWRFARNNPVGSTAIALFMATLIGWSVTTQVYSRQLVAEREAAEIEALRAQRVKGFLIDVFRAPDLMHGAQYEAGADVTLLDILPQAEEEARRTLKDEPEVMEELLDLFATLYFSVGREEDSFRLTEELLRRLETHPNPDPLSIAHVKAEYGAMLAERGSVETGRRLAEEAMAVVDADPAARPGTTVAVWLDMGAILRQAYDNEAREALMRRMIEWLDEHEEGGSAVIRGEAQHHHAAALLELGRSEEALEVIEQGIAEIERDLGKDHIRLLAMLSTYAAAFSYLDRYDEALPQYERALAIVAKRGHENHPAYLALMNNFSLALGRAGKFEEEQAVMRDIIVQSTAKKGENSVDVANHWQNLGSSLVYTEDYNEAEEALLKARSIYVANHMEGSPYRSFPLISLSGAYLLMDDYRRVIEVAALAEAELQGVLPEGHYAFHMLACRRMEAEERLSPSEARRLAMRDVAVRFSQDPSVQQNPLRAPDVERCCLTAGLVYDPAAVSCQ